MRTGRCKSDLEPVPRSQQLRSLGRDIRQIMLVTGSFVGMTDAFQEMSVENQVYPKET